MQFVHTGSHWPPGFDLSFHNCVFGILIFPFSSLFVSYILVNFYIFLDLFFHCVPLLTETIFHFPCCRSIFLAVARFFPLSSFTVVFFYLTLISVVPRPASIPILDPNLAT